MVDVGVSVVVVSTTVVVVVVGKLLVVVGALAVLVVEGGLVLLEVVLWVVVGSVEVMRIGSITSFSLCTRPSPSTIS